MEALSAARHKGAPTPTFRTLTSSFSVETQLEALLDSLEEFKTKNAVSSESLELSVVKETGPEVHFICETFHTWGPRSGCTWGVSLCDWSLWKRCGISHHPSLWTFPMANPWLCVRSGFSISRTLLVLQAGRAYKIFMLHFRAAVGPINRHWLMQKTEQKNSPFLKIQYTHWTQRVFSSQHLNHALQICSAQHSCYKLRS